MSISNNDSHRSERSFIEGRQDSPHVSSVTTTGASHERYKNNKALNVLRNIDGLLHTQGQLFVHETLLGTFLGSLIRESHSGLVDLIPAEGYFLDAGMQFGEFGAHMAVNAPERDVMMLDPSPKNVKLAKEWYGALPNLKIRLEMRVLRWRLVQNFQSIQLTHCSLRRGRSLPLLI